MIHLSTQGDIDAARKLQKTRILDSFEKAEDSKAAQVITKAEFDTQYPDAEYERYSLKALHSFRGEITKAEDIGDKDQAFKEAIKDLKSFIVHDEGKKFAVFVRKKEVGEK